MQHIIAHKKLKEISTKVIEIYSIYNLLKSDINRMSQIQIDSCVRKILNKLSIINEHNIDELLEILKPYLIYERINFQLTQTKKQIKEIKSFIYSLNISSTSNKKLQEIKDRYHYIKKNEDNQDLDYLIRYAKITQSLILKLNFEQLSEQDNKELFDIKAYLTSLIKTLQGIYKSRKYGPYLYDPIYDLVSKNITKQDPEKTKYITTIIIDYIEQPDKIDIFERYIKRIIEKKITYTEFIKFYKSVLSMKKGEKIYESSNFVSYNEHLQLNETYDSFVELQKVTKDLVKVLKTTRIKINKIYKIEDFINIDSYSFNTKLILYNTGLVFLLSLIHPGALYTPQSYRHISGYNIDDDLENKYKLGIIGINVNHNISEDIILHELQHARDVYVSKGKLTNTKISQKYLQQTKKYAEENMDNRYNEKNIRLYVRTPHEQSAFFVEAINKIDFFDETGNMLNIHEAHKIFSILYNGYDYLQPKDKIKLGRKFAQYYYKIKEDQLKNSKKYETSN